MSLLEREASRYTWVAATIGANSAAGYELATKDPVLAIGGFNGTDPAPTLTEFQSLVAAHRIHYLVGGGMGGPGDLGAGASTGRQITSWVAATFGATTVDGVTVYDLAATPAG